MPVSSSPPGLFVTAGSSTGAACPAQELEAGDTYTFAKPIDWNVTVTSNTGDALLVMGSTRGGNGRMRALPG